MTVAFRQLLSELPSIAALAEFVAPHLPEPAAPNAPSMPAGETALETIVREQMQANGQGHARAVTGAGRREQRRVRRPGSR